MSAWLSGALFAEGGNNVRERANAARASSRYGAARETRVPGIIVSTASCQGGCCLDIRSWNATTAVPRAHQVSPKVGIGIQAHVQGVNAWHEL